MNLRMLRLPLGVGGDLCLLVPCGLSGHLTEAQAEENARSPGYDCLLLLLSFLFLLALHAKTHPTTHPRGLECAPWTAFKSLLCVCVTHFTPTRFTILTPPDRASLFRCRIVGFSHKVFTGNAKYNHGFMNMN